MSKDFEKQVLDQYFKDNQKLDPFVFITPELNEFIQQCNAKVAGVFIGANLAVNLLLAPLQTIITSLQLSVKKHRDIFQTPEARTKQLAKLNTDMTVHDKRKFQLMIRAGKSMPYVAPVYGGYKETINGLMAQGWRAFYKGLGWRSLTTFLQFHPYLRYTPQINQLDISKGLLYQIQMLGTCMLIDIFFNPLYLMEYRYILQNQIRQFRSIHKPSKFFGKIIGYGQAMKGISFHVANNFIGAFTRFPIYVHLISGETITNPLLYALYTAGEIVTYPISTAYKRLQCQTERFVGMIPVRYSGLFHAMRVMWYEEGPKGLWRAFPLHLTQNIIRLNLVSLITKKPQIPNA